MEFNNLLRGPQYLTNEPFVWTERTLYKTTHLSRISSLTATLDLFADRQDVCRVDMEGILPFGTVASTLFEITVTSVGGSRKFCTTIDYVVTSNKTIETLQNASLAEQKGFDPIHISMGADHITDTV